MFRVTTPAASPALLSDVELRAAAGVTGSSYDATLATLGLRAAAAISVECAVPGDGVHVPTLLSETIEETLRPVESRPFIVLSRRFVTSVTSIVEDGDTIAAADYWLDAEAGIVHRLDEDCPSWWSRAKIVVTYVAGFATAPDDLKAAAATMVHSTYLEGGRDPLVKGETVEIPGVMTRRQDYWVGGLPQSGPVGPVPQAVAGLLTRYRKLPVG